MMAYIRRFFGARSESREDAERRELEERLISEHSQANQRGRKLLERQSKRNTMRYYSALNDAMKIMGE